MSRIRQFLIGGALAAAAALSLAPAAAAAAGAPGAAAVASPVAATQAVTAAATCGTGSVISYDRTTERAYPKGFFCMKNGTRDLVFQADGNLVLYSSGRAVWQSGTAGRGSRLFMQSDGNLVIYTSAGAPVWQAGTYGGQTPRRELNLQGDGNLVIYEVRLYGQQPQKVDASTTATTSSVVKVARWQSNTAGR